jgi:hypothetical protein
MSRKKAGDQAGIVAEMLKDGGPRLREAMADVFTDILCAQSEPPASWRETKLKVLFKKGEQRCLENYRPISIVPILYKVFSRIVDARLRKHIAGEQSPDQAGFRPGFGCEDHLFAMAMLGEKCSEFNIRVWVVAVDFKKAFDSVEHESIWEALSELGAPQKYVEALRKLYDGQRGKVVADKESKPFSVDRGTKQGDPVSPTLFNAVVEVLMRKLKRKWAKKRWGMDVDFGWPKQLQNLRFADDLILVGKTLGQATQMLGDLMVEAGKVGLGVHAGKTKILSNVRQRRGAEREKEVEVRFF